MKVYEYFGKVAYDAYCGTRDWKSYNGEPLPQWPEVEDGIKNGWITAALAAINKSNEPPKV